ncbi:MAG: hypothetical protein WAS49_05180 [Candidatus Dechloromonas phosphoritropha]|nr:hypothetical protein [Candidatus Dechloromonas phosphoritropha]MBP8789400.1 hypothetical protein [Azonexus sp.]
MAVGNDLGVVSGRRRSLARRRDRGFPHFFAVDRGRRLHREIEPARFRRGTPQRTAASFALDQNARGQQFFLQLLKVGFRSPMPFGRARRDKFLQQALVADGRAIGRDKGKQRFGKG